MKPGDKVTSPLLVGEWIVHRDEGGGSLLLCNDQDGAWVQVHHSRLTLVAPPLPPEPPVGSVVWVDGVVHRSNREGWWVRPSDGALRYWSEIAARAVPAVDPTNDDHLKQAGLCRVEDVAEWLGPWSEEFRARFGGAS